MTRAEDADATKERGSPPQERVYVFFRSCLSDAVCLLLSIKTRATAITSVDSVLLSDALWLDSSNRCGSLS